MRCSKGGRSGREAQSAYEPGTGFPTERDGEQMEHLREADGAAGIRCGDLGQPLGEDPPRAQRVEASEFPDGEVESHPVLAPGQVGERAGIPAMDAPRERTAERAGSGRPHADQGDGDLARHDGDGFQAERISERKQGSEHTSEV
jgi:hypothetical protein